jgi:hypothetical protein
VVLDAASGGVLEVAPVVPPVVLEVELFGEDELDASGVELLVPVVELLPEGDEAVLPPMLLELPVELAGLVWVADVCPVEELGELEVELLGEAAVEPD